MMVVVANNSLQTGVGSRQLETWFVALIDLHTDTFNFLEFS